MVSFYFDPEDASRELLADSLEVWAELLLKDYKVMTGFPLAHEWQKLHGPIPTGCRLMPRVPFIAGGSYSVDNLFALESAQGMRFRGAMAKQISNLPNGVRIEIEWTS